MYQLITSVSIDHENISKLFRSCTHSAFVDFAGLRVVRLRSVVDGLLCDRYGQIHRSRGFARASIPKSRPALAAGAVRIRDFWLRYPFVFARVAMIDCSLSLAHVGFIHA